MTFREKSAWCSLIATLVVFVPYFREIFSRFAQGNLSPAVALGGFIGASIYITVLSIVAEVAVSLLSRPATTDERDVAIAARSYKTGYYALMGGAMTAVVVIIALSVVPLDVVRDQALAPAFLGQVLLLCCVLAEFAKSVVQIVGYRRGF
jgi:hypothetical protein